MDAELLDKGYEPAAVEKHWYEYWEREGLFDAEDTSDARPYAIVIPPPNVTGVLHMGHALNNTLQDILCRYRRLKGDNVLWMPGTDHAGIATQNVVERQLAAEGYALIMTTHNPEHAIILNGKVAILNRKGVLSVGQAAETLSSETLSNLYGLSVKTIYDDDAKRNVCIVY